MMGQQNPYEENMNPNVNIPPPNPVSNMINTPMNQPMNNPCFFEGSISEHKLFRWKL